MFCFMEQNGGPLVIVNSLLEEVTIQRHNFKRKIGRGVSISVAQVLIPPTVSSAKSSESLQDERVFGKAFCLHNCDSAIGDLMLIVTEIIRGKQHRHVGNE